MTDASELEDEIAQLRDLASDADDQPDTAEQVVFSTPWTKRAAKRYRGILIPNRGKRRDLAASRMGAPIRNPRARPASLGKAGEWAGTQAEQAAKERMRKTLGIEPFTARYPQKRCDRPRPAWRSR